MHTWLIFSGCIPTRSMSTLYIRDISVNKSKQSVWTRRGNIPAHYNAGAGAIVTSGVSPWSSAPCAVQSCAPVRVSSSSDAVPRWAAVYSTLTSAFTTTLHQEHSIHCLVESKLDERNVMDILINAFWYGSKPCRNRIVFFWCVLPSLRTAGNYSSSSYAVFALV